MMRRFCEKLPEREQSVNIEMVFDDMIVVGTRGKKIYGVRIE